jgi:hypothetical protein
MKKTTSLILVLLFSVVMLFGEAINTSAEASLCCNDLTNCCNDECCSGPGNPSGCALNCQDGTGITCPKKNSGGTCSGSGDDLEIQ